MNEEEKKLLTKIEEQVKGLLADAQKEFVKKSDVDAKVKELNDTIAGLSNDGMKELKDKVDKLMETVNDTSLAVKSLKEQGLKEEKEEVKSFRDVVKNGFMELKDKLLKEKNDDYGKRFSMKEYFDNHDRSPVIHLKDAVDMLQSEISQNYVNYHRLTDLDPNRVGTPLTIYPHVLDVMPTKRISKPYMALLVVYSYEDGAGTKTEGSASSKSSFLFKTVNFPAFFIATYFTLSDETLDDLEEALDEISIVAPDKIRDEIDDQVLGTAGNDSSAIAGLFTANKHTDFDTTTYADFTENANIIDLIAAMKLQCEIAKYRPDSVWMHPQDVAELAALKDVMENSVADRRISFDMIGNPVSVCGLRILQSTAVTADTMAVVDSKQTWLGIRKDMTMEIGYNGTDLTEGQKTVVIKVRVAFGVRDKAGVIYSDSITDDIVIVNKAGA